jgi:hypothetical protein
MDVTTNLILTAMIAATTLTIDQLQRYLTQKEVKRK